MSINIREIAKLCNVSPSTVSCAINNKSSVKKETRERIHAACRKYNYDPLAVVPLVKHQAEQTYGLVLPYLNPDVISMFLSRAVNAFINLDLDNTKLRKVIIPVQQLQALLNNTSQNPKTILGVGKVILFAPNIPDVASVLNYLQKWKMPTVLVNRTTDVSGIPVVRGTESRGITASMDHLFESGHRSIAMMASKSPGHARKISAFRDYCKIHDLPCDESRILRFRADDAMALPDWVDMCLEKYNSTAFLCQGDEYAAKIIKILAGRNLTVPGDISVTGYSNDSIAELINPALTTYHIPVEEMIEHAFLLLNSSETWNPEQKKEIIIPGELIIRDSTGPCRA